MTLPQSVQPSPNVPSPQGLQIELPIHLDATYSNLVVIQHTPSEFVLDFARILPNMPAARVGARIVTTPMHAKLLLRALQQNIERFEAQFGPIYVPQQGEALANQLFGG
ncbi:MAG: DUF3467 domain-containing protein [Anaerolineae bacterium]|nr:DUF3467 domain-containing protein [Candidatus Roseilinea sp.]MDW8448855.1 DUF3467 domain-containing protein [Anaerolineae bacterium]